MQETKDLINRYLNKEQEMKEVVPITLPV